MRDSFLPLPAMKLRPEALPASGRCGFGMARSKFHLQTTTDGDDLQPFR